jgi:outer membrane protein OmpA-like peptidoglycan-associated protein
MTRTTILGVVVALALPSLGLAQRSATLNRFRASETVEDDFHLSRPTDLGHLRYGAMLHLDYANDPLIWETDLGERDSEAHRLVEHQLDLTLGLSVGLFDRVVVFAGVPVSLVMNGDPESELQSAGITASADGAGLGDVYLGARARLYGESGEPFALGLQLTATLPTAGDQRFRGDDFLSFAPELLAEVRPGGGARVVLNVGARVRKNADDEATNITFGDELTFGLGFALPVFVAPADDRTHVDVHAQIYGSTAFADAFGRESTPLEGTVGAKLFHASGVVAGLAGGMGFTRGLGSPDARVIAMLGYGRPVERVVEVSDRDADGIADEHDHCPDEPEDVDTFEDANGCPDPDNDSDGVLDGADACPMDAEDVDGFEDEDGCPDPDNDQDEVLDASDQCPLEAEDRDGFEDDDGCPDPDNDGDGVPDASDRCPDEAGVASNAGCPEPDRDGDTVIDRRDNCPDVVGTPENEGCPQPQQVRIEEGRLEILDVVYFRTNRAEIQERSFALLRNVALVLHAHPEIAQIRIEGHTDSRGRRDRNVRLSQQRAEAVLRFLVDDGGLPAERLIAQGFGPDRPLVPDASNAEQHAQNRRVEFNIVNADEAIQTQNSGPSADTVDR